MLAPNMGARKPHLSTALFNGVRLSILQVLFARPHREYYYRELLNAVGTGQGALQRELDHLADAGILVKTRSGRHTYYGANPDSPVYRELSALLAKLARNP
jgi:DNA-binding transcriptional ArsR family regulator